MRHTATVVRAIVVPLVLAVLGLQGAGASASTEFTMSPGGAISATSSGRLTFEFGGRFTECNVTLNGRLVTAAVRIAGGVMGEITEGRIRECTNETVADRFLLETAWRITSNSMLSNGGMLPDDKTGLLFTIRSFKVRFTVLFAIFGRCLYEGDVGVLASLTRVGSGRYSMARGRALPVPPTRYISGAEGCPTEGTVGGEFNITSQTITVR